ncbi:MAG: hypothetical protein K2X79_02705 [Burkholderiaceae bacterium]|nr:hypothetical protein [Burkholderiaceae bacterium]
MRQDFTTPTDAASLQKLQSLNTVGTISYVLHLIVAVSAFIPGGQFGVALLVVALILDMVKREDAAGTWHASHFRWRIRSVLMAGLLYIVTAPLWLLLIIPGYIAWGLVSLWFLYRIVSGFIAMNKGQEIGA